MLRPTRVSGFSVSAGVAQDFPNFCGDPPLDAQLLHGERFRPFTPCKVISDIYYMRNRAWLQGMRRAFAHIQEEKKKFFPIF